MKKKTNRSILSNLNIEVIICGEDPKDELAEAIEKKLVEDIANRLEDEEEATPCD